MSRLTNATIDGFRPPATYRKPATLPPEEVQRLVVQAMGDKRMTFKAIHALVLVREQQVRDAIRTLCMAGVLRVEHNRAAFFLKGGDRMAPLAAVYCAVKPPGLPQ